MAEQRMVPPRIEVLRGDRVGRSGELRVIPCPQLVCPDIGHPSVPKGAMLYLSLGRGGEYHRYCYDNATKTL
jgi:hypothetical protein